MNTYSKEIKILRAWGNGNREGLMISSGLCLNSFCGATCKANKHLNNFIKNNYDNRNYPIGGVKLYREEQMNNTIWDNPERLQLCLDFADHLENLNEHKKMNRMTKVVQKILIKVAGIRKFLCGF